VKNVAARPNAKPYWLILNIGVKVSTPGVPTVDFELIDTDHTGLVTSNGNRKELDLSRINQRVLLVFTLEDTLGLQFPDNPQAAIGIEPDSGACPSAPSNATAGMFLREGMSMNRRRLAVMNQNPGSGHHFLFALFLVDASGALVAVCDPRIINN